MSAGMSALFPVGALVSMRKTVSPRSGMVSAVTLSTRASAGASAAIAAPKASSASPAPSASTTTPDPSFSTKPASAYRSARP